MPARNLAHRIFVNKETGERLLDRWSDVGLYSESRII